MTEIIFILSALLKLVQDFKKAREKAKEQNEEAEFVEAVHSGDVDAINRWLYS